MFIINYTHAHQKSNNLFGVNYFEKIKIYVIIIKRVNRRDKRMTRDNKIKDYVTLVRPSFWRFIFQLFTAIIAYVTVPVAAIFAAKAIVSLTVGDFKQAIIWLGVEAGLHILRQIIWSVNYKGQGQLFADNYRKVQNKIFDKVTDATTDSLRGVGREKILNGVNSDADALASFTDTIATQLSKAVQLGITFVIILTYNVWVALLLLVLGVADYFILGYLNKTGETSSLCDMLMSVIDVSIRANLPSDTTIGSVTPFEIGCLSGSEDNLQWQINLIKQRLDNLEKEK